jgi:aldehyde dehydrogenase (NAD(P)+)
MSVSKTAAEASAAGWRAQADESLKRLASHRDEWARLAVAGRIDYLQECRKRAHDCAQRWVEESCRAKGLGLKTPAAGEEWSSGPWGLIFGINAYLDSLREIEAKGTTTVPRRDVRRRADGQVIARVWPHRRAERVALAGLRAEVWMEPAVTIENLAQNMGAAYRRQPERGAVALVLGAGNVSSIAPMDVLHKLLAEHCVVLLKMNPVNDYLGPIFEDIFDPLVRDGFLAIAYGGPEVGEYLAEHAAVDEIHMTGSDRTHDAIVFGTGPEGMERKRQNRPRNLRRMTSELGNVTPMIVVPGPWDEKDIRFQAENIVTTKLNNAGFNCIATQVLVLPESWDRSGALLDAVRDIITQVPPRPAYYPGAALRQQTVAEDHPDAEIVDGRAENGVPRTLVSGLDSSNTEESCFRQECFSSVLATTSLPGTTTAEYLRNAIRFCNSRLWGTLGASLLIHPATIRKLGPVFEDAIADLRYGTIGVNIWCGLGYLVAQAPWGAYPGHTLDDVQSGIGWVHNTRFFDRPQKSVVYGPFFPFPRSLRKGQATMLPHPPWFILHRRGHVVTRELTGFEFDRKPARLRAILAAVMRP